MYIIKLNPKKKIYLKNPKQGNNKNFQKSHKMKINEQCNLKMRFWLKKKINKFLGKKWY